MSDEEILAAIAAQESGGDPNAVGKAGEIGKYQFMPALMKSFGVDRKTLKGNAKLQDELALKHFAALKEQFEGDPDKIIAAWNAGPGGVNRAVAQGGADWHKFLPKGPGYDAGHYLTTVKGRLAPQQPTQVAQAQPEPAQAGAAPAQAQQAPPTPPTIIKMGADQTLAQAYHDRRRADAMQWMMQDAPAEETKPAQKPEQKPQEAGGFFNSIGDIAGGVAKGVGAITQPLADFILPKAPVENPSAARRVMETGGRALAAVPQRFEQGVQELSGLAADPAVGPSDPMGMLKQAGRGVMGAIDTLLPFGGAANEIGQGVQAAVNELAPTDNSEGALRQQLDQLRSIAPETMRIAGPQAMEAHANQIQALESLLMMAPDAREAKLKEMEEEHVKGTGQVFEMASGIIPGYGLAGQAVRGAGAPFMEAQAAIKAARQGAILAAAEKAVQAVSAPPAAPARAAAKVPEVAAAAGPQPPKTLADLVADMQPERTPGVKQRQSAPGSIPQNMMTLEKLGAHQKLALIENDPAARAAIGDIVADHAPQNQIVTAPGSARVQGTQEREALRQQNIRGFEDRELPSNMPERTAPVAHEKPTDGSVSESPVAAPGEAAPEIATTASSGPVARIVSDSTFEGKNQRAAFGPNDDMIVSLDAEGKELGYIWYTNEPGGGFTVRYRKTAENMRRKGVMAEMERQLVEAVGPFKGNTMMTEDGKKFRDAMGGMPKLTPAPEELYRDMLSAMRGDPDLTAQALKSRGYGLPELAEQEAKAVHEVLNVAPNAAPEVKAAAAESAHAVAADIGITTEAAVQAAPAISRILKSISAGDLKSIREIINEGMRNAENPLSALRAAQAGGESGRIDAGLMFIIGRAALGGVLGGLTGDDPESSIRNVLYGAGIGMIASPKLAKTILGNITRPEVREALENVIKLHGEEGAVNLRFPARGVGKKPSPNTETMGVSAPAKRIVRGINEKLEKLGELDRATTQTHEMTKTAALHSKYNTVEGVLSLDSAKLSPEELASAVVASKNVRDSVAEGIIELNARAKLTGDTALADDVVTQFALLSQLSRNHTNLETALGRATNAMGIMSDTTAASKFDLTQFAKEAEEFKGIMLDQGKVSPEQLVEMISNLADKAANTRLANVASKYPPALWNIYYGLNLLSSPLTHMRNFIGNTGALGMAVVDRGFGEILGPIFRVAGKTDTVAPGETYHLLAGIYSTVADSFRASVPKGGGAFGMGKEAFKTGVSKFKGGNKYSEALAASAAELAHQAGQGTLPWVIQTMSTLGHKNMALMSGVDEFYKVLSFQGELRALARRGSQHLSGDARLAEFQRLMDDPTTDMLHGATAFADENTFTKAFKAGDPNASKFEMLAGSEGSGAFGGLGKTIESGANHPIMKVLATPFYRTPMRIGEFSTVHTPLLNALAPQTWSDMAAGGVKQQLAIAKVMTGTAMMGLVGWWASHGYITGAPPSDAKMREELKATGWQEFSVYVPGINRYISYQNIEPLTTIVGTMATFMQVAPDLDEASIQTLFSAGVLAVSKNNLRQQWWQGISDLSDMASSVYKEGDATGMARWAARKSAALIPGSSLSRYVQNASDPYQHEPEIGEWKKLVDIYAQNIPGWGGRNALEIVGYKPRPAMVHGITGETLMNENQWLGMVAPFRISRLKNDPVLEKLVELGGARLPKDLIPKVLAGSQAASDFKLQGSESREMKEGVALSNEQRHRLGELLTQELKDHNGDTLHKAMAREMREPDFEDEKGGPDGGQAYRLATIYHEFLTEASQQLRDEFPAIDIAIMRRQEARDARRLPKSMEHLRQQDQLEIDQEAAARGVR